MNIENYFPISSQSSVEDRAVILKLKEFIKQKYSKYNYVEIGSYLGGSLTPHLIDTCCLKVLSIDDRERQQPDERGVIYDYAKITNQTMLDKILSVGLTIEKLETFDGDLKDYLNKSSNKNTKYHIAFIDGEHTNSACFSDFVNLRKLLETDSIVAFHDSHLVFSALKNIKTLLESEGAKFKFIKVLNSDVSFILFGDLVNIDTKSLIADDENWMFIAESKLLLEIFKNRLKLGIIPPRVFRAY